MMRSSLSPAPPFSSRTTWNLAENKLARCIAEARATGRALIDLTESNPTRVGVGGGETLVARLGDPRGARYAPQAVGHPVARAAVARYYAERKIAVDPERVVLSASTSEAYGWLFKLLAEPGDNVLVPAPSYPLLAYLAGLEGVALSPYHLREDSAFRIDLDSLVGAIDKRTRAIVLIHPNNPTGSFVRRDDAKDIDALAARHGIALVADEVFGDYAHGALDESLLPSFAADRSALTFVLSGLSKVVAMPQLKLGWIAAFGPDAVVAEALARLGVIADTYLSVATPVQLALGEILAARGPVQAALLARAAENLGSLDAAIAARGVSRVRRLPVDGGWCAIVCGDEEIDEEAFATRLVREESVIVHPGYFFDMPRAGTFVVSLLPEPRAFAEGASRLAAALASAVA